MRAPKTRFALGMTILCIEGRLKCAKKGIQVDHYDVKTLLDDWNKYKLYYATKKHHARYLKDTMFGVSRREIIEVWLSRGYAVEKKLKNLVEATKHTARQ